MGKIWSSEKVTICCTILGLIVLGMFKVFEHINKKRLQSNINKNNKLETNRLSKYCNILGVKKNTNIFIILIDPLRNNYEEIANTLFTILSNATCSNIFNITIVTSTLENTQQHVQKKIIDKSFLNNILLQYVYVPHPCSVDVAVNEAISTAYKNEEYICIMRAGVKALQNWDMHVLQQYLSQPEQDKKNTVITSCTRNYHISTFPAVDSWLSVNNINVPIMRWVPFKTKPITCQPSIFMSTLFCFSLAKMWFDAPADIFLPPITPSISDWLYTCRLKSIGWNIKVSNTPLIELTNKVTQVSMHHGLERYHQWFSNNIFANIIENKLHINIFEKESSWAACAGIVNIHDEDEILFKYGSLYSAEKQMSKLRHLLLSFDKLDKKSTVN